MAKLSNYTSKLPTEAKFCYIQKLKLINNVDPFEIGKGTTEQCAVPLVDTWDITWCYKPVSSLLSSIRRTDHWKHITNLLVVGSMTWVFTVSGRSASLLDG